MAADSRGTGPSDSLSAPTLRSDNDVVMSGEFDNPLPEESPGRYDFALGERGDKVELGHGGLGQVLAARDVVTGRVVALKQLWKKHLEAGDTQTTGNLNARFLREARITAQLEHPAIVPVYDLGRREDDAIYYTMRRIHGRTLHQAAQEAHTHADRLRLLPAVVTVCRAIAYAHSRGVLHRDIKPQNVMLGPFGETYLLDWGLSRRIRESTSEPVHAPNITGSTDPSAIGTPAYMSPEQAFGAVGHVDERSDVFGLGTLLFEVLAGRAPRLAKTAMEAIILARSEALPRLASLAPEVPPELAAVCDRALAQRPAERYPSATALADELESFLHGKTVSAYRYGAFELVRRFAKAHRAVVTVAAVALVALLVMGGMAAARVAAEERETESFARLMLVDVSRQVLAVSGSAPLLERLTERGTRYYADPSRVSSLSTHDRAELATAWNNLARVQMELGNYPQAETALDTAQRLAPPDAVEASPELLPPVTRAWLLRAELARFKTDEVAFRQHLLTARALVDSGPARWDLGAWHLERRIVYAWVARWEEEHRTTADALAAYRVAMQSAEYSARAQPESTESRAVWVNAIMELAIRTTDVDRAEALALGTRAVEEARKLPVARNDPDAVENLGSLMRQQALILRTAGRSADAMALEREARPLLERALKLIPNDAATNSEYVDLLLQQQDWAAAVAVLRPKYDHGAEPYLLTQLLTAELGADHPEQVVALSEVAKDYDQKLFVALALLRLGRLTEAAAMLQSLKGMHLGPINWPGGVVSALAEKTQGPAGALLAEYGRKADALAEDPTGNFTLGVDEFAANVARVAQAQAAPHR